MRTASEKRGVQWRKNVERVVHDKKRYKEIWKRSSRNNLIPSDAPHPERKIGDKDQAIRT